MNISMRSFISFLIVWISVGVYVLTDPAKCGALCIPPELGLSLWLSSFVLISLFLLFVFPAVSPEQIKNSAMLRYVWVGMIVLIVYQVTTVVLVYAG